MDAGTDDSAAVLLRDVRKEFPGGVVAADGVNLEVPDGEFLTLLGPSGSGKTTVLRMIAGFEMPSSGQILLGGRDVSSTTLSPLRRWQGLVHRHPGLRIGGLLSLPMAWLVLLYIVPLAMLFVTAFWTTDSFTGEVVRTFTAENFQRLFTDSTYVTVALRTLGVAVAVTLLCLVLAVPVAFYIARVAPARRQPLLVSLMLTPLWASYLVKVYAWRVIFSPEGGVLESTLGFSPGFGWVAVVAVLTYLWLPYMILPVYVGMQNVPQSLLDASSDLGASSWRTFRSVLLPIVFPSIVAGSVFTFSLSLGDYITVQLVGGKATMLGNVVYQSFSTDLPFAAAVATFTILIMVGYLTAVRRTGALENL